MNRNKKIIKVYFTSIIFVILNFGLFLNTYSIDNSAKLNLLKTEYNPGEEVYVSFENVPQNKVYYIYLKNDSNNLYTIGDNNFSRRCILYQTNGSFKFLAPNKKGNWYFEIVSPSDLSVLAKSRMFAITKEAHDNVIDDHLNITNKK